MPQPQGDRHRAFVASLSGTALDIDLFNKGEAWTVERRPQVIDTLRGRLQALSAWLGDQEYLEGEFTAADIIMTSVLREVGDEALMAEFPNLVAYRDRCVARPAFQRAIKAQLDSFAAEPVAA